MRRYSPRPYRICESSDIIIWPLAIATSAAASVVRPHRFVAARVYLPSNPFTASHPADSTAKSSAESAGSVWEIASYKRVRGAQEKRAVVMRGEVGGDRVGQGEGDDRALGGGPGRRSAVARAEPHHAAAVPWEERGGAPPFRCSTVGGEERSMAPLLVVAGGNNLSKDACGAELGSQQWAHCRGQCSCRVVAAWNGAAAAAMVVAARVQQRQSTGEREQRQGVLRGLSGGGEAWEEAAEVDSRLTQSLLGKVDSAPLSLSLRAAGAVERQGEGRVGREKSDSQVTWEGVAGVLGEGNTHSGGGCGGADGGRGCVQHVASERPPSPLLLGYVSVCVPAVTIPHDMPSDTTCLLLTFVPPAPRLSSFSLHCPCQALRPSPSSARLTRKSSTSSSAEQPRRDDLGAAWAGAEAEIQAGAQVGAWEGVGGKGGFGGPWTGSGMEGVRRPATGSGSTRSTGSIGGRSASMDMAHCCWQLMPFPLTDASSSLGFPQHWHHGSTGSDGGMVGSSVECSHSISVVMGHVRLESSSSRAVLQTRDRAAWLSMRQCSPSARHHPPMCSPPSQRISSTIAITPSGTTSRSLPHHLHLDRLLSPNSLPPLSTTPSALSS
ncbi:unnamed protein product [Closterium sp. NIES-64]|nr:unnamed protein product [Closterium sp. NIES-64]